MARQSNADTVGAAMQAVVTSDAGLREQLASVINRLLKEMDDLLKHGNRMEKTQLIKAIVPGLLRAMQDAKQDSESQEMHRAFQRVMTAVGGGPDPPTGAG